MARPAGMSDDDSDDEFSEYGSFSYIEGGKASCLDRNGFGSLSTQGSNLSSGNFNQNGSVQPMSENYSNKYEANSGLPEKVLFSSTDLSSTRFPHRKSKKNGSLHQGVMLPLEELRMQVVQGNLSVVKGIFSKGVAVDQTLKNGWTSLMHACSCGKTDIVKYLLQSGANPNLHKELYTALMAACASSQNNEDALLEIINCLIDHGASINASERHRMTALMFASKEGRTLLVKRLLDAKAEINKQDNKGYTALSWASTMGHGKIVRLLLEYSADPVVINNYGQKPADMASAAGFDEIADVLERASSKKTLIDDMEKLSSLTPELKSQKEPEIVEYGDVEMILSGLGLASLIQLFQKNNVTMRVFLCLTEKDLLQLGVESLGNRKKILEAVTNMNRQEWKNTSLPDLRENSFISLPEAIAMVSNVNKHLKFIHASIGYLRDQIQHSPRILQIGQEKVSVSNLANHCGDSIKRLKMLKEEVHFFKAHLDKVSCNSEFIPADLIINKKDDGRRWQRHFLVSLVAITSVATVIWFTKPKFFAKIFSLHSYPQKSVLLDL